MYAMYFGKFHMKSVKSFINKMFIIIIIFEIHTPTPTLQYFL